MNYYFFFFNDTATTEIYTLSLHDALPIYDDFEHAGLEAADFQCLVRGVVHAIILQFAHAPAAVPTHVPSLFRRRRRSEEHTSELQSQSNIVCRLLLAKQKQYSTLSTSSHH